MLGRAAGTSVRTNRAVGLLFPPGPAAARNSRAGVRCLTLPNRLGVSRGSIAKGPSARGLRAPAPARTASGPPCQPTRAGARLANRALMVYLA